jgi:dCTP deaminase
MTANLFDKHRPIGFLTSEEIEHLVNLDMLIDKPTFDRKCLDACSYDIRVGKKGLIGGEGREINLEKEPLVLLPGCWGAFISYEKLTIPMNVFAKLGTKRAFSYQGLILLSGSLVDPGYEGFLLFGVYNASTSKKLISIRSKICSTTFYALSKEVDEKKPPDPDLIDGNFPSDFIQEMANIDVATLSQIQERLKQIPLLEKDIQELRTKYEDVLNPIRELTENVTKLETITDQNARQISKLTDSIDTLCSAHRDISAKATSAETTLGSHASTLENLKKKVDRWSVFWWILVPLTTAILGVVLGRLFQSHG